MCFLIFESLTFMLFGFSLIHKMYLRSISTFIGICTLFVFVIYAHYTGDMDLVMNSKVWAILCVGELISYYRGMRKPPTDRIKAW